MTVEVRTLEGEVLGKGQMLDSVALMLQRYDQVVFPFVNGCWVIRVRHLMVHKIDGEAELTLLVEPREN